MIFFSILKFFSKLKGKKVKAYSSSRVCGSRVKTIPLCLLFWEDLKFELKK
jgi:hypothetical protein